jgi:plasmid stabilization system protein ParE
MAFSVEITDPARNDIDDAVTYIAQHSTANARKWKTELQSLILSLAEMPGRFPLIPEAEELDAAYRSARHYSHRVIYRIDNESGVVYVVRVYHGARQPLTRGDIAELEDF